MPSFKVLPLLLITGLLTGCTDDFTLEGDFRDVPTAYAYLDADDDRHFVRVQRAFLEAGGNAATNAAIADSIYYGPDDASVILVNGRTAASVTLNRVDGADFGLDREEGVFATEPNVLYTIEDDEIDLRAGDDFELHLERPGQPTAVASSVMLEPIRIASPADEVRLGNYDRPLTITLRAGPDAAVYDIRIRYQLRELYPADPSRNRDRELEWVVAREFVPGNEEMDNRSVRFLLEKEGFYRFLGENLEVDDNVVRRLLNFDLLVTAAGREVLERRILAGANAGITSAQVLPRYTNLEGGIGLVTSTTSAINEGITLDATSRDTLENGFHTRRLNFR